MAGLGSHDPYEILGIRRGASDREIAAAHRALARQFHPDIAGDGANADMVRINAAFDAIRTAQRRAAYDDTDARPSGAPTSGWSADPATTTESGPSDFGWTQPRDGTGGAGRPPGRPSGSVLDFGRHIGWSIGEIARVDPGYLVWLEDRYEGRKYLKEIDETLRRTGYRTDADSTPDRRPGRRGYRR